MQSAWDNNPWSEGGFLKSQDFLKVRSIEEDAHQCGQQESTEANTN